jgi:transposase-like protein
MGSSRRRFLREWKIEAVQRVQNGVSVAEVARTYQIDPNVLRRWRRDYLKSPDAAFPGSGRTPEQIRIAELLREVASHAREIERLDERLCRLETGPDARPHE